MKESLKPGIKYVHKFKVPPSKTVPALYPESDEFVAMPEVFATGFLVGFLEWACIKAINPHLDVSVSPIPSCDGRVFQRWREGVCRGVGAFTSSVNLSSL